MARMRPLRREEFIKRVQGRIDRMDAERQRLEATKGFWDETPDPEVREVFDQAEQLKKRRTELINTLWELKNAARGGK